MIVNQPKNISSVRIGSIDLFFRNDDVGGRHYLGRSHVEEYSSPFYRILHEELSPQFCFDIGANYGYTGLLLRKHFPYCKLTLVEPIPWLQEFINLNFEENQTQYDAFFSAIISLPNKTGISEFGINLKSSQDSRVIPQPGFEIIKTNIIGLNSLLKDIKFDQGVYIKIDTQGWEESIIKSGEEFLSTHQKWLIKTEFAPKWLESQGTRPTAFLSDLLSKFGVYEHRNRIPWNTGSLMEMLGRHLEPGCEKQFVEYVKSLDRDDKGWVDLILAPKSFLNRMKLI